MRAARQHGGQILADSLKLQQVSVQRAVTGGKGQRGRRRKGDVIDLENRQVIKSGRRRWLKWLLIVEAIIAVIAVSVLIAYLVLEGETLQ